MRTILKAVPMRERRDQQRTIGNKGNAWETKRSCNPRRARMPSRSRAVSITLLSSVALLPIRPSTCATTACIRSQSCRSFCPTAQSSHRQAQRDRANVDAAASRISSDSCGSSTARARMRAPTRPAIIASAF